MDSDLFFYFGIFFIAVGLEMLSLLVAYNFGKKEGAKEYYNLLTSPNEQEKIK